MQRGPTHETIWRPPVVMLSGLLLRIALPLILFCAMLAPTAGAQAIDPEVIYDALTPRERVGQLFMMGFRGKTVTPTVLRYLQNWKIGGVILFSHNISDALQTARLCEELRKANGDGIPLVIATDQEGGRVIRITRGVTVLPANMALGATRSDELAYISGKISGAELRAAGITMNLAPVLDVNTRIENEVIGTRAFGDSAALVASQGHWYIRGLQEEGISATAKHFPGHGATTEDSHHNLPSVGKSLKELLATDLFPFKQALLADVDAIMMAHVHYRAFDRHPIAASLSPNAIRYLRNSLGFKGLILSDEFEMGAITKQHSLATAAVDAINAGNDMLIAVWNEANKQVIFEAVERAVASGAISQERLRERVVRILRLKLKRKLFVETPLDYALVRNLSTRRLHKDIAAGIAQTAITVVRNTNSVLPLTFFPETKQVVCAVSSLPPFLKAIAEQIPSVKNVALPSAPEASNAVLQALPSDCNILLYGIKGDKRDYTKILPALQQHGKLIVCSFGSPYSAIDFPEAAAYVCSYSLSGDTVRAMVDVLTGKSRPRGLLPVALPGFALSPIVQGGG